MINENSTHYRNIDDGADQRASSRDAETSQQRSRSGENDDDYFTDNKEESDTKSDPLAMHVDEDGKVNLMDVYEFKQSHGYLSILFSITQTLILIAMVVQCGLAPMSVNPMVGPYPDVLSYWGSTNSALIIEDGEKWRLVSPVLLHAGLFHLIGNVGVQMDSGVFFEKEWGSLIWVVIYISGAIGASMISIITKPESISVGSSGAVMALFGAKMSEVFCRCCESKNNIHGIVGHLVRKQQCIGVVGGVTLVMLMSFIPYVDWGAHLGGLIAGMAVGMVIFSCYIKSLVYRLIWFLIGAILTAVGFAETAKYLFNDVEPVDELRDVCEYYKQFFDGYECSCRKEDLNYNWGGNNDQ
mmetsp:Transcript_37579/g.112649  ORF Transcript_37579/g.112649 Transcript_37579/m.112649 type:complete len:355 (-) Transcript_37579:277-1341(-)|eukprot:CAMPEP_0113550146 /NCGR_PEP_ID=MMETSP0015_2-20120614/13825_1 /TAXON_ID=2838 /ORGANISM="Odontella" /LENGTH=354 /DNA_ID=CAMNT_0000450931 /DNA_START=241 /DNA_END=1305 /DNA_ORIENTATION=+ /assembly_acc=CAM_ASM_000160